MLSSLAQPPFLNIGDKIAIICTGNRVALSELSYAVKVLEDWGLEVVIGDTIDAEHNRFAGSDALRAKDLQSMLDRTDIKGVLFARGGYGTIRILDMIDFSKFTTQPKWLVGYSDVTVLHAYVNNYLGIQTIHSTMPINFENNSLRSLESLKNTMFGNDQGIHFIGNEHNKSGKAEGRLIGGNLSILYSILGTKSGFNTDNCILFIEDLNESYYHLDRMLIAHKRAGKLDKLIGLVVGGLTDMKDGDVSFGKSIEEIVLEHCSTFDYPVCFHAPMGHVLDNRSLVFGKQYQLNVADSMVSLTPV